MANVTAATGKVTIKGSQRTLEAWILRSEQLRINSSLSALAYRDGWDAFYNPGDPDGRTLVGSKVSTVIDILGNWPDLTQGTDANRPVFNEDLAIPVLEFAGSQSLQTTSLPSAPISQPFSLATGLRHDAGSGLSGRFIGLDAGSNFVEVVKGTSSYYINAGSSIFAGPASLTGLTPVAATFDGASSRLRVDANNTAGDAGAYTMSQVTLGSRSNSYTTAATGIIGPVAFRLDNDVDATWRMAQAIYAAMTDTL